jgi:hypothetical protein
MKMMISTCAGAALLAPWRRKISFSIVAQVFASAVVIGTPICVPGPATAQSQAPQFAQQGQKLVGSGAFSWPIGPHQGYSVALSADGSTAIIGGPDLSLFIGATWVFTRRSEAWTQQGDKLIGIGPDDMAAQGVAVGLSADGNTAIVGAPGDNTEVGTALVFTRSNGVWTHQGDKLVGTGAIGQSLQGSSVGLSADGNTAIMGGSGDNSGLGAAWVFTRSNGVWTQQGDKLVGTGAVGQSAEGSSIALSADGNTAIIGGSRDNSNVGAAWVFTRSNGVWTQQGDKLVGSDAVGNAQQGMSVALSADGNTAIIGGPEDASAVGAAWVFTRSSGVWTKFGQKLTGSDAVGTARQGGAVALSGDGDTAIIGGYDDNAFVGAAWVFARNNWPRAWTQLGNKLVGTGTVGKATQGYSVALSADSNTAIIGGAEDNGGFGAAWVFVRPSSKANRTNTHDFNGDGLSDIAWRDSSGNIAIWLMNGTTVTNSSVSFVANVPNQWAIVGQRDFDGDGYADLLWHDTSGNVAIWEMNGTAVLNASNSFVANVPTYWSIAGTGDFNGDGLGDLLWQDMSGNVAIWEMNGTTVLNQNTSFVANVPSQWSIKGTADFNGDGKADLLWQDTSGNVAIWEMDGTAILNANSSYVATVPANWSIAGTGDFNGDGMGDLLWRDTSGNVAIWEMNGTTVLNASSSFVANVPSQWSIQLTGDYNSDGMSDILWQDTSGNVAIWEMNGTAILNQNSAFVANVAGQWSIQRLGAE